MPLGAVLGRAASLAARPRLHSLHAAIRPGPAVRGGRLAVARDTHLLGPRQQHTAQLSTAAVTDAGPAPRKRLMPNLFVLTAIGLGVVSILVEPDSVEAEQKAAHPSKDHRALVRQAFGDRSTLSLLRSLLIYEMCAHPTLVSLSSKLIDTAEKLPLLNWPVRLAVRETAFRQFCGGESVEDTLPLLRAMHTHRVTGILDLSIEADIGEATRNMAEDATAVARGESELYWQDHRAGQTQRAEQVTELIERGIRTAKLSPGTFFAVKCTALASDPEVLEHWSVALRQARSEFEEAVDGRCPLRTSNAVTAIDVDPPSRPEQFDTGALHEQLLSRSIDEDMFVVLAERYMSAPKTDEPVDRRAQLGQLFRELDRQGRGRLDWIDYVQLFSQERLRTGQIRLLPEEAELAQARAQPADVNTTPTVTQSDIYRRLHPDTQGEMLAALERLESLCNAAVASAAGETSVRLMIDAEQSYLQPAIAYMARQVAVRYNGAQTTVPLIYDTHQLYLRSGLCNLLEDIETAQRGQYHWAGKLVRGAYVSTERRYARETNSVSAVWPTKSDTDRAYDIGASVALQQVEQQGAHAVVATHNHASVAKAVRQMERATSANSNSDNKVAGLRERVHFAQLLGMGELITARLTAAGYQSAKYVPYGPVQEVIPYLLRRAEENGAMFANARSASTTAGSAQSPLVETHLPDTESLPGADADADEDRKAVIQMLRERLGWRRWVGLR